MAASIYTNALVYIDGKQLTENSQISISGKSGKNVVHTIHKGMAGISLGSGQDDITLSFAVPSDDFGDGLNPSALTHDIELMRNDPASYTVWHDIVIVAAGKTYQSECIFMDYAFSYDVNSPATLQFTIIAKPALFK